MSDLKNIKYVLVATDFARQATTILDDSSATYIKDGEIVVTDKQGNLLDTDAASYTKDEVVIVMRQGTKLVQTPPLSYKNIIKYEVKPYVVATQQISYIGYNGTTGDLENDILVPATDYIVTLRRLDVKSGVTDSIYWNKSAQWYNSLATSGQETLADGLAEQLTVNFNNDHDVDNYVIFERICSHAGAAITGTTTNIRVVNGSKTAIIDGTLTNVAVGDYIRINGTTVGTPVYKVTAYTASTSITLDVPYQGTSGTILVASNEVITAANAAASNWGIKCTGAVKSFSAGIRLYDQVRFDISLKNFNDTTVSTSQYAYLGNGTYENVAEEEWYNYGAFTLPAITYGIPVLTKTLYAVSGKTYDWITLHAYDNSHASIQARPESFFQIMIGMPVGCTQGDAAGSATVGMGVATALDTWLTTMTGKTYNEDSKLT